MAEEVRSPRQDAQARGWARGGPRSLLIRRCEHGFGFTLRHFIVYPPESYSVLAGDRRLGLRPGAMDEPMDTIFVKQVKRGGPADRAGLQTGDRVVSVNGENISGESYAGVVHKIHTSGQCLHLLVVPQQDDILQLYFNETAHRPESNLDVIEHQMALVREPSRVSQWCDGTSRRSSETNSLNTADSGEAVHRGYPSNVAGCRLSLDAGLIGRRDSASHEGSASSLGDHSSDDSVIISRIRKSFEQKEEFLKRPAAPLWPSNSGPHSGIKEFYARPQKLQPRPHWPPTISVSPNHSPIRSDREDTPPAPADRGFLCGGPVTNAPMPCDRRLRPGFVSNLGRIQETSPPYSHPPPPQIHVVSKVAKQFESGSVPDRTSLYRSELARLSNKRIIPDVSVRAREYENKSEKPRKPRETRSLDANGAVMTGSPMSGNQTVLVGGRTLHCEPPVELQAHLFDEESFACGEEAWLGEAWPQRHKAVRQDSYLAACHKPVKPAAESTTFNNRMEEKKGAANANVTPPPSAVHLSPLPSTVHLSIPEIRIEPAKPEAVVEPILSCKPVRPMTLDIPSPLHPRPLPLPPTHHRLSLTLPPPRATSATVTAREQDGCSTEEESNSTPLDSPSVVWREKPVNDAVSEEERATRRVSYLKATWPDRMNVDSDPDASDSEPPVRPPRKWRPPLFPDDIQKIRRFFEDTPYIRKGSIGPRHSLCDELSLQDKDHQVTHEGLLHCKLTLIEGKRAADRSWKQVWAVLRGPVLYLYKERRDSLPSETPMGAEAVVGAGVLTGERVDVRGALVAPADNYTKRKHVLRVNTLSGSELLLQAADASHMDKWIIALEEQANNNNTQNTSGANLSPSTAKGLRKLTSLRNRSPTGQSPVNKTRKPSQQVEPLSSPKTKTWKGRVAKQFRRIQQGGSPVSPTSPLALPDGANIGIPLEHCQPSSVSDYVPLLVEMCTNIVEEKGLEVIGIYRVPGNTAAVSSLTEAVNRGGPLDPGILDQDQRWKDVNVISSLLKSFFRRLPDSLLTAELYPSFIQADKITDPHLRMATIRKLVHDLPDHHYETLKYLLLHLKRVVENACFNKMEARNLAIVFGPTLVRTADENMVTMVTDMSSQCRIVETLILHVDWCFGDEAVERLALEGPGGGVMEPEPPSSQNLLLSNIHKMEGMNKELSARDIVSSIICAANRKMLKSKSRSKTHAEDTTDHAYESKQRMEVRVKERLQHRKERLSSTEDSGSEMPHQSTALTSESTLPAASQSPSQADNVAALEAQSGRPQADDGTIRTYAGLSATTQERIRRFELETKAMLHRDTSRVRRLELETDREQSKRELEADENVNPSAIVKKIVEPGRASKPLAIVPPSTEGRGRSSRSRVKEEVVGAGEVGGVLRRGTSVENVNPCREHFTGSGESVDKQNNGNLKRFKTGYEQGEGAIGRFGSLDSLHDITPSERPSSHISDEGGDLLVSLTSTFDAKLKSLLSPGAVDSANPPSSSAPLFSDPSLHKASDKEGKEEEKKEECCAKKDESDSVNLLVQEEKIKEISTSEPRVRLYRSESVNKEDRERKPVSRSQSLTKSDSFKLRRSESLNKENRSDSSSKLKRSDSLTKNEKTESNLNKRRQLVESNRWNMVKLKRKTGSAIDRSIKRRHTVGGTKDFDKVNWLDNRQREAQEEGKERRTSSPDLSSARLAAVVVLRPHSFAEPTLTERLCGVPLESHV